MLPHSEVALLVCMTLAAVACAEQGRPMEGYDCLAGGLCRAQYVQDLGTDWAATLVQAYQGLMTDYAQRFGIHLA
jgi:hypothetical protein